MDEKEAAELLLYLQKLTGRPQPATFRRAGVQPPGALYVERDDRLFVRLRSMTASGILTIGVRMLKPDGDVVPFGFTIPSQADSAPNFYTFDLTEGFLLSVVVTTDSLGLPRGRAFVEVGLFRNLATAPLFAHLLLADHLTTRGLLAWPAGREVTTTEGPGSLFLRAGGDPAAGAEAQYVNAADSKERIISVRFTLVTSAAAPVRRVHLVFDDQATTMFDLAAADTQAASLTRNYNCLAEGFQRAAQDSEIYIPLPPDFFLTSNFRLRTLTTNLDVADNFGGMTLYTENWLED